ncbi:AbrB family transcriptional regulator [Formicincola oecophyllae]|uniref:AbrB family transcriptional regulator n=1 Tax=Formicincola oecophyllae TaxID=2558361 RepID=A0A4Y6U841_9PROT|nr:AbrB family transcriptional regulator [Formicincola oecophyllae]QDH13599.1 AbrB family transcriptional regulator [Formicincola oecophyllae]
MKNTQPNPRQCSPKGQAIKQWGLLLLLSAALVGVFALLHLAAGFMLGPMIAAIYMALHGKPMHVGRTWFAGAQAVLGALVVSSLSWPLFKGILDHGALMGFTVLSVIVVSFGTGALLAWLGIMPGTTALWGASPGGASTMVMICGAFGADPRLAAFMLYFRVILVAVSTSLVAWWVTGGLKSPPLPPMHMEALWPTLALVIGCTFIGTRMKFPAATLFLTMVVGGFGQLTGLFHICPPQWLRVPAYLIIGWCIGLRFNRAVLGHALRALPAIMMSAAITVGACALLAWPVAKLAHIDLLSAYLATSPGGLDTIIIISATVPVALPFIISMQTARMVAVIVLGPLIAKPLGTWLERHGRRLHVQPISGQEN